MAFFLSIAVIAAVIWVSWPAAKPALDCGDILGTTSFHECDTTKGSTK